MPVDVPGAMDSSTPRHPSLWRFWGRCDSVSSWSRWVPFEEETSMRGRWTQTCGRWDRQEDEASMRGLSPPRHERRTWSLKPLEESTEADLDRGRQPLGESPSEVEAATPSGGGSRGGGGWTPGKCEYLMGCMQHFPRAKDHERHQQEQRRPCYDEANAMEGSHFHPLPLRFCGYRRGGTVLERYRQEPSWPCDGRGPCWRQMLSFLCPLSPLVPFKKNRW